MSTFDRRSYDRRIPVIYFRVAVTQLVGALKALREHNLIFSHARINHVRDDNSDDSTTAKSLRRKIVLLDANCDRAVLAPIVTQYNATITDDVVLEQYEHLSADEVIKRILPSDVTNVSSFETVGHIAHLNLLAEHSPFATHIAHVIMDKNTHIRTVVNKTSNITSEFRTSELRILCGDDDLFTSVSEHGIIYEFDFARVYWNSRLQTEHKRLQSFFHADETIVDVFAGVGPFVIPAAKHERAHLILANDKNADSVHALIQSAKRNKVRHVIHTFHLDGRDFTTIVAKLDKQRK